MNPDLKNLNKDEHYIIVSKARNLGVEILKSQNQLTNSQMQHSHQEVNPEDYEFMNNNFNQYQNDYK